MSFWITFPKWSPTRRVYDPEGRERDSSIFGPLGLGVDSFTTLFANEPRDIDQGAMSVFNRVIAIE